MSSASPPRLVIRGIAVLGGLLALAAVGLAADHRGAIPLASPVASATALPLASAPAAPRVPASTPAPAPSGSAPATDAPAGPGILPDGRVVLNLATEEELQKLPGVGPSRARAIAELRKRRGKLKSLSELLRVKGIGRKTLARLAPKLVLDPPPA